jgi:hypothetical protein
MKKSVSWSKNLEEYCIYIPTPYDEEDVKKERKKRKMSWSDYKLFFNSFFQNNVKQFKNKINVNNKWSV